MSCIDCEKDVECGEDCYDPLCEECAQTCGVCDEQIYCLCCTTHCFSCDKQICEECSETHKFDKCKKSKPRKIKKKKRRRKKCHECYGKYIIISKKNGLQYPCPKCGFD